MKTGMIITILLFFVLISNGQDVVQWKFNAKKKADKTYEIHFTPIVQSPWHIYSLRVFDDRALPTTFSFNKNPLVVLDGKVKEIGMQNDFVQVVKLKSNVKTNVTGEFEFMACNDTQCLPP